MGVNEMNLFEVRTTRASCELRVLMRTLVHVCVTQV